ncbi:MAG: ADP-ribosylglycohydrolase family protein [Elusimicrobia bacterium]|nr:ADP-ribosylglycohydrolase family protein [Elusimicrobiota bacterium]
MESLLGVLLGTAVGDALGLPAEGMSAPAVKRRFGRLDRYRLLGAIGFVSDDTEQSALVAQALCAHHADPAACAAAFRRSLVGWFWRLPWGVGLATLRACLKGTCGLSSTGVRSAGNGAAMRAAVAGVFHREDAALRRSFSEAVARVTHTDPRAVQAAVFVAEAAALAAVGGSGADRSALIGAAARTVDEPELAGAIARALTLAGAGASTETAAEALGTTGYSVHTAAFAAFQFVRHGGNARECLVLTASAGGDSDSIGAIVGGWLGALHGSKGLPNELVDGLAGGPFGRGHLEGLAAALAEGGPAPRYFWPLAMARNLLLIGVILAHGLRRLFP